MKPFILILTLMNPESTSIHHIEILNEEACNFASEMWLKEMNEKISHPSTRTLAICVPKG